MNNNPYDDDHEKLLSLSLATNNVKDIDHRNKKRKRTIIRSSSSSTYINNNNKNSCDHESFESKVFRLIQTREEMLRQGHLREYIHQENNNGGGLHLIHLLLVAAAATAKGGAGAAASSALESLRSLYSGASLTGDSIQRVAAHFADALAARLLTRKSPFFHVIMKGPTSEEELSAFAGLYRASPLLQFAHFTANQAILEAMGDNINALHVIDFDVSYGFQWPSLIQSLAEQKRTAALRITGFGASTGELRETEERLLSFARGFRNLSFDFRGVLSLGFDEDFHDLTMIRLKENIRENEILAVNLVLPINNNNNNSTTFLNMVRSLDPTVVVLVEQEVKLSPSFVGRFVESLHYFAAMFDSLDDSLPSDSAERLSIEKNHLGTQIKALLNQDDGSRRSSTVVVSGRERMESHGFRGVKVSSKSVIQAKLLLKMRTNSGDQYGGGHNNNSNFCGGFRVSERDEGMAISLGWQNRYLITASVWH